eukprot:1616613-Lingulodinium_polyedra.AAC.1
MEVDTEPEGEAGHVRPEESAQARTTEGVAAEAAEAAQSLAMGQQLADGLRRLAALPSRRT